MAEKISYEFSEYRFETVYEKENADLSTETIKTNENQMVIRKIELDFHEPSLTMTGCKNPESSLY